MPERKAGTYLKLAFIKLISIVLGTESNILSNYIKAHKIDLVHAHFADIGWRYLFLARRFKIPFIVSFYGWDYEQLPYLRPQYRNYFKKLFATANGIVCEGPHGAETLVKAGCPREKLKIVRLGVEVDKIPFYRRTKKAGELKLVQLATFNEKKGHIYSLMAFEQALATCPNMHLTLAGGDGSEKIKVMEYMKLKGLESKVQVMGSIEWTERFEFFKDFHVFIHPSCYARDMDCEGGAPIVLLDAQATGLPVIATRHCDIPEEVINGITGKLATEANISQIAIIIAEFYEMQQREYFEYCVNARNHVLTNFNIVKNVQFLSSLHKI